MRESVIVMTREQLYSECAKLERECLELSDKCKMKECQIKEMQSHIDCLKAELAEIQMNKQELPEEPIKVADWLIDKLQPEKIMFTMVNGKSFDTYLEHKSELKQIAEHLLVYCNHSEVE